ncbi:VCBS repeat-containing protein [Mucilaginibacter sp. L3T2-6]|uniref:FG-GAP repeat domain-containing protein n=1 Tax=Mucilaginibacter sp. L3T2-6 TaxID=3062491 RepID=UPI0026751BE8|nr:VCBS repeat-containing protein [Mucilaginibacter sp. L3T2-6]MDO3642546.1 VCBS repeat-containing protein [Mucilaginibacter sp. L3T2-6]MDV6215058.1 VCBS repeat-containing protein [Mucilaginibacter sp. L3T2-6]
MTRKAYFLTVFSFLIIIAVTCSVILDGCKGHPAGTRYVLTGDTIVDGKNLVQQNCAKCHSLVPVNALTKDVWKFHTLPLMSKYVGITYYMNGYYKRDSSGLTLLEWQNIQSYYQKVAPDSLPKAKKPIEAQNDWAGFLLKKPGPVKDVAYTTLATIDPFNHKIYTADGVSHMLQEWGADLKPERSINLPSPAVNASFAKDEKGSTSMTISCIGQLDPVDFPNGKVINLKFEGDKLTPGVLASEVPRAVQAVQADFNKDGLVDWIVLGQGYLKGGVTLFRQNKDKSYQTINVSNKPGAVKEVTGDFNNDGWTDLMVLFGRGDESLILFLNDQHGNFTERQLLRFQPVYGSTDFALTDLDKDGNPDLVYTCGFNYNESRILKPYHGLYVYRNTGNWNFKQEWFYPVNGCTKLVTADFNGDGKLDIMTSAFFADLKNNPAESCIYFEQDKPFSFKPHNIPVSKYGRWMNMDVGDYNNDGRPDVILANYSTGFNFQNGLKQFWDKNTPFILLQNNFKR